MRIESVGKKILQLCTYFKNDSLPLVGTFNSERVMLLSLLLLLLHPPPLTASHSSSFAWHLLRVLQSSTLVSMVAAVASRPTDRVGRGGRKSPKWPDLGARWPLASASGLDAFIERAPRVGRSHGRQLLGIQGQGHLVSPPAWSGWRTIVKWRVWRTADCGFGWTLLRASFCLV